jgi:hypothetical protein
MKGIRLSIFGFCEKNSGVAMLHLGKEHPTKNTKISSCFSERGDKQHWKKYKTFSY